MPKLNQAQFTLAEKSELVLIADHTGQVQWWTNSSTKGLANALRYAANCIEAAATVTDDADDEPFPGCLSCNKLGVHCGDPAHDKRDDAA